MTRFSRLVRLCRSLGSAGSLRMTLASRDQQHNPQPKYLCSRRAVSIRPLPVARQLTRWRKFPNAIPSPHAADRLGCARRDCLSCGQFRRRADARRAGPAPLRYRSADEGANNRQKCGSEDNRIIVILLEAFAVLVGFFAVAALIQGTAILARETRLAVQVLRDRADNVRRRLESQGTTSNRHLL